MKKISVIIPCYNCADIVQRAWNSLYRQTIGIEQLECIFVDDASNDNSATWNSLLKIEADAPDSVILVKLDKNMRQGGARNAALSYASAKYLMFLDSDDELVSDACDILYQTAENTSSEITQFNHIIQAGHSTRIQKNVLKNITFSINTQNDRNKFLDATTVTYGCWNKLYLLSLVIETGVKFAEHVVYEEPLFVYPLFLYAKRITLITDPLYIYHIHDNSTVTSQIGKRLLDHPQVQLLTLEDCMRRPKLFNTYRAVIGIYFIWSYYCETLCFAAQHKDASLSLVYFSEMQKICKTLFPDYESFPLYNSLTTNVKKAFETLSEEITSQQELDQLVQRVFSQL